MDSIHIFLIKEKMCILHIFITRIWLCGGLSSASGCYVLYHFIHDIEAAAYEAAHFQYENFSATEFVPRISSRTAFFPCNLAYFRISSTILFPTPHPCRLGETASACGINTSSVFAYSKIICFSFILALIISCAKPAHDQHSSLVNHASMLTRLHSLYRDFIIQ